MKKFLLKSWAVIAGILWFLGMAIWTLLTWRRTQDAKAAGDAARKEKADELEGKTPGEIVDSLPNADDVRDVIREHGRAGPVDPATPTPKPGRDGIWGKGSLFHRGRVD